MKDSPESAVFSTRRIALVEGDRTAAEMLHTFFRLMDLEPSLVEPDERAIATIRRLAPDVVLLDADLPNLRAVEIALELTDAVEGHEPPAIIFLTSRDSADVLADCAVVKKPTRYEDCLALMEVLLEVG
ncbi:MAG TPA: response regulator [Thermoanaerobaculia bacterium]|jgi:DNA-binding response OmpR family regulator